MFDGGLGREPLDYDVATSAPPETVRGLFRHTVPIGAQFGVILVVENNLLAYSTPNSGEFACETLAARGPGYGIPAQTIDGTDVSNSFREFGLSSEHSEEDVSGFSVTGTDEFLPGRTDQSFTGEAFYTEELATLIHPIHANRTVVEITWQPDGLVDATREVFYANCTINQFGPTSTRGSVNVMPFSARPADENGIRVSDFT